MVATIDSHSASQSEEEQSHYLSLAADLHNTDLPILDKLSAIDRKIVLETYLEGLLQGERELIGRNYGRDTDFNIYGDRFCGPIDLKVSYRVDRTPYFPLAETLAKIRPDQKELRILEIGGGDGSNMLQTVEKLTDIGYQVNATLTGLNELPQHQALRERGIDVQTRMLAESLPPDWTENFDLVMSACCMPWTNLYYSLKEVQRVLAPTGAWLNLEAYESYRDDSARKYLFGPASWRISGLSLPQIVKMMKVHGMEPDQELASRFYSPENWIEEEKRYRYDGLAYIKPAA
ncbi:MAG: hypothetical protein QG639_792 [Patescibacteria group bacterium]|jgi:ubiquinone/menaquinone biosynthesis C-methylase UbiE|nr:hypothetical protein [Patescibacteria group bacterium]